jgi:DNA-binding transcriptional ArsR family regulator
MAMTRTAPPARAPTPETTKAAREPARARGIFGIWEPGARSAGDLERLIGKTRAALLGALTEPASTTGLAARTGIPVSSVSEHLAVLRATGLVATTRTGRFLLHQRTTLGTDLVGPLAGF